MEKKIIGTIKKLPSKLLDEVNGASTIYRDKFGEIYVNEKIGIWTKMIRASWLLPAIWIILWLLIFYIWLYDEFISSNKPLITYLLNSNWTYQFLGWPTLVYFLKFIKSKFSK